MEDESYEDMLEEVDEEHEHLKLMDGSTWFIDPEDWSAACTWTPTAAIQVSLAYPDAAFPYELRNLDADAVVRAMRMS